MTNTATLVLTYGVTLLAALTALALDAAGRRSVAIWVVAGGLGISSAAGIAAGLTHTQTLAAGPVGVGGPASMIYGVIALVGLAAVVGGSDALVPRRNGGSITALVAFAVAAGGGVAAALDLTTLLLLLETLALIGYALVAVEGTPRAGEASMKYFVQGAVATALFLFGMAVLVGLFAPSGEYSSLGEALISSGTLFSALAGVGLVLAALAFKMGAVPFHSWAPDAYETASVENAAFLAAGPKLAAIGAMSVFVTIVSAGPVGQRIRIVVAVLAVLSVLVGSIAALQQKNYRRLLAYAGIAQTGYALIAIAVPNAPLAVFFGSTYALAATGTFLAASAFGRMRPEWDGSVAGLAGLGRRAPVLSGSVAVLLISLAGVPPFLGFWAKLLVFGTGVSAALGTADTASQLSWWLIAAVSAGIVGSIVSLGYYGAILRSLFFDSPDEAGPSLDAGASRQWPGSAAAVVVALAVLVVVLSLVPLVMGPSSLFELFSAR